MKIAILQNDKSFLSFDLKVLLWLILVVGVWATQDYRIKYTNNVLRWNEELQETIGQQSSEIGNLTATLERSQPTLWNIVQLEEQAMEKVKLLVRDYSTRADKDW